MNIKY